jgi:hypothetical protein
MLSFMNFTDRTRELLFSGSKRSFDIPRDANGNEIFPTVIAPVEDINMEDEVSHDKQMLISNTGQLTAPEQDTKPTNAFQALMMARKGMKIPFQTMLIIKISDLQMRFSI